MACLFFKFYSNKIIMPTTKKEHNMEVGNCDLRNLLIPLLSSSCFLKSYFHSIKVLMQVYVTKGVDRGNFCAQRKQHHLKLQERKGRL